MKTVQVTKTDVFQAQSGFLRLTGETAASELELLELGEVGLVSLGGGLFKRCEMCSEKPTHIKIHQNTLITLRR